MSKIQIDKNYVENNLLRYIDALLALPEVEGVKLCDIVIQDDEQKIENLKEAVSKSYHDCYSDSDISIMVNLPTNSKVTTEEYMKHPGRFGITPDNYLGFVKTGDSGIYRIIFKDGTRYDFGFEFRFDESYMDIKLEDEHERYSNPKWPIEKVDEFWFVLVQQMILRDIEHGTNHHRYGYGEELQYRKHEGQNKFLTGDDTFDMIADKLYAVVMAYDDLTELFYPEYERRREILFDIWACYHANRLLEM